MTWLLVISTGNKLYPSGKGILQKNPVPVPSLVPVSLLHSMRQTLSVCFLMISISSSVICLGWPFILISFV